MRRSRSGGRRRRRPRALGNRPRELRAVGAPSGRLARLPVISAPPWRPCSWPPPTARLLPSGQKSASSSFVDYRQVILLRTCSSRSCLARIWLCRISGVWKSLPPSWNCCLNLGTRPHVHAGGRAGTHAGVHARNARTCIHAWRDSRFNLGCHEARRGHLSRARRSVSTRGLREILKLACGQRSTLNPSRAALYRPSSQHKKSC